MKIVDITQEVFSCQVFPGNPAPAYERIKDMGKGDICTVTAFSMCAHNGTHVDAPAHFIADGKTVDQMDLSDLVGPCVVLDEEDWVNRIPEGCRRIVLKTWKELTLEEARMVLEKGVRLVALQNQRIGDTEVHQLVLGAGLVPLEGVRVDHVPAGPAFLAAQPLNLAGAEGAPCRALLLYEDEE